MADLRLPLSSAFPKGEAAHTFPKEPLESRMKNRLNRRKKDSFHKGAGLGVGSDLNKVMMPGMAIKGVGVGGL